MASRLLRGLSFNPTTCISINRFVAPVYRPDISQLPSRHSIVHTRELVCALVLCARNPPFSGAFKGSNDATRAVRSPRFCAFIR